MPLRDRIQEDMKAALRARDKDRLSAIRLILAAIKQREVDERIILDDTQVISVLERMCKQRRESIMHYQSAGREDLAAREVFEIEVIQSYMPEPLSKTEIETLIQEAIIATGAESIRDMGEVMNWLKNQIQGRAEMGTVSALVKTRLAG
jgi:uncharacterized protein YqeY